ncbi:hypothetical protein NKG05_07470 [Oerskovia sp. M15]
MVHGIHRPVLPRIAPREPSLDYTPWGIDTRDPAAAFQVRQEEGRAHFGCRAGIANRSTSAGLASIVSDLKEGAGWTARHPVVRALVVVGAPRASGA